MIAQMKDIGKKKMDRESVVDCVEGQKCHRFEIFESANFVKHIANQGQHL